VFGSLNQITEFKHLFGFCVFTLFFFSAFQADSKSLNIGFIEIIAADGSEFCDDAYLVVPFYGICTQTGKNHDGDSCL
jgi:hypothetical protein